MSGNYDFPPASNSTSRRSASDRPQENYHSRLQNLRDLILFSSDRGGRERSNSETIRALDTLNDEIEELRAENTRRRLAWNQGRAAMYRQPQQSQNNGPASTTENAQQPGQNREQGRLPSNTSGSSINNTNQVSFPAHEGARWNSPSETVSRLRGNNTDPNSSGYDLERATAQLREADAAISSILNGGITSSYSGSGSRHSRPSDSLPWPSHIDRFLGLSDPGPRWRSKRRKLDSDDNREGLSGFSYGHYGQVVPGPLKMEISSCDGGNYYDEGESSWPGNVLLDDSSVYCTKKSRCNMVLNHRGETPFCLKQIVIRAPKKGFDAPIQEGMIFVSMSSDDLLERTAQYQLHYPQSQRCHHSRRHYTNPSREYMNAYRARNRGITTTTTSAGDLVAQAEPRRQSSDPNELPRSRRSLLNPTYAEPQFRVTTENDINSDDATNDEQDNDELPSATEIELLDLGEDGELFCPEDEEDSDDGDTVELNRGRLDTRRQTLTGEHRSHYYSIGSNRLDSPSLIEPVWSTAAANSNFGGDMNNAQHPDIMKPHARFFIEREKSMVSIKFDPPVSGRFILVKLWSPYSDGNIDIEGIMVYGFAGTRYFPALDVR